MHVRETFSNEVRNHPVTDFQTREYTCVLSLTHTHTPTHPYFLLLKGFLFEMSFTTVAPEGTAVTKD